MCIECVRVCMNMQHVCVSEACITSASFKSFGTLLTSTILCNRVSPWNPCGGGSLINSHVQLSLSVEDLGCAFSTTTMCTRISACKTCRRLSASPWMRYRWGPRSILTCSNTKKNLHGALLMMAPRILQRRAAPPILRRDPRSVNRGV